MDATKYTVFGLFNHKSGLQCSSPCKKSTSPTCAYHLKFRFSSEFRPTRVNAHELGERGIFKKHLVAFHYKLMAAFTNHVLRKVVGLSSISLI